MYSKHRDAGLEVVGVPTTEFRQEFTKNTEVAAFVKNKGVTFTMLELSKINGADACPLYQTLKEATAAHDIHWNFGTYFVVDRAGMVTRHDKVAPKDLEGAIV